MNRLFISDKDFAREVARTRANGYKRVVIDENVDVADAFEFKTRGTDLVMTKVPETEGDGEYYTLLCQEFGLVGGSFGFTSKVSVIFCDAGWMLITLHKGGLVMHLDGQFLMPTIGDIVVPRFDTDDILWVNADRLLGYSKFLEQKGYFMYDHEFMLEIGGDSAGGLGSFKFRSLTEETVDISLGYIAQYEQQKVRRREAFEAQRLVAESLRRPTEPLEFEDPEYVNDGNDEEDDDSGVEW